MSQNKSKWTHNKKENSSIKNGKGSTSNVVWKVTYINVYIILTGRYQLEKYRPSPYIDLRSLKNPLQVQTENEHIDISAPDNTILSLRQLESPSKWNLDFKSQMSIPVPVLSSCPVVCLSPSFSDRREPQCGKLYRLTSHGFNYDEGVRFENLLLFKVNPLFNLPVKIISQLENVSNSDHQ